MHASPRDPNVPGDATYFKTTPFIPVRKNAGAEKDGDAHAGDKVVILVRTWRMFCGGLE